MCLNNWYTDSLVSVCLDRQTGDVRLFKQESIPVGCVPPACPNCISFNSYQMSVLMGKGVLKWTSLNRSPVLVTRCHYHRARADGGLYSEVPCLGGGVHVQWGPMPRGEELGLWGPCSMTDNHDWKHYLPATSLAGGNNWLKLEGNRFSFQPKINSSCSYSVVFITRSFNFKRG